MDSDRCESLWVDDPCGRDMAGFLRATVQRLQILFKKKDFCFLESRWVFPKPARKIMQREPPSTVSVTTSLVVDPSY